ncbi:MAG: WG repeat-containing protein [Bacteroidia bacterium]|nr:WG repeat-containing protein [Bacteroidia bacterium]
MSVFSQSQKVNLIPYHCDNLKWGYSNSKKEMVIPCQYDHAGFFEGNFAIVKKKGKFGVINKQGTEIIPFSYGYDNIEKKFGYFIVEKRDDSFTSFDGIIPPPLPMGLHDTLGNLIAPCEYDQIGYLQGISGGIFFSGMALVKKNNLYGFINLKGREIIPCQYTGASVFMSGFAEVKLNQKWGVIDTLGKVVIPIEYENINIKSGFAEVSLNKKWGLMDMTGKVILPIEYEDINFSSVFSPVAVKKNNKWGYVDRNGKRITDFIYEKISTFDKSSAWVKLYENERWGKIDIQGNVIVPFKYQDWVLNENYTKVEYNYLWGLLKENKEVIPCEYEEIDFNHKYDNLVLVRRNNKNGYLNLRTMKEIIPCMYEEAGKVSEGLIPVKKGSKWGFVDTSDKIIIPFEYDFASSFSEGFAVVGKDGKSGVIHKSGKTIIPLEYQKVKPFSDGLAAVYKNEEWAYYTQSGEKITLKIRYDEVYSFKGDKAFVRIGNNLGMINRNGEQIIPCKWYRRDFDEPCFSDEGEVICDLVESVAVIDFDAEGKLKKNEKKIKTSNVPINYIGFLENLKDSLVVYHYSDPAIDEIQKLYGIRNLYTGKEILPFEYEHISEWKNGVAVVKKEDKYGAVNEAGKLIIPLSFESIQMGDSVIWVRSGEKYGIVDFKGKTITPCIFYGPEEPKEGLIRVYKNNKYGYVDMNGKEIIPCQYEEAEHFCNGEALVKSDTLWGIIDKQGKQVVPVKYTYIDREIKEDLRIIEKGNQKFGVIDKKGKEIIPCIYQNIMQFSGGMAGAKQNGKYGFLNKKGKKVINFEYDAVGSFNEGFAAAKKQGKWGFIDSKNKVVIPFMYDSVTFFSEGWACVKKDGKWGFIDKNNTVKIPFTFQDYGGFYKGFARVQHSTIINSKGEIIAENVRAYCPINKDIIVTFGYDDMLNIINLNGEVIFSIDSSVYSSSYEVKPEIGVRVLCNFYFFIDKDGNEYHD